MQIEPPNFDAPKGKRRWFQFSLRTLFLVVTAFGVWLGWESHVVRERKAKLDEIKRAGGGFMTADELSRFYDEIQLPRPTETSATIPFFRTWFGDEPIALVQMPKIVSPEEKQQIASLFPEAKLQDYLSLNGFQGPIEVPSGVQFTVPDPIAVPDQTLLKYEPISPSRN